MRRETKERTVIVNDVVYIAEDGKEFATEQSCIKYEKELEEQRKYKLIEKLRERKLDELIPIHFDAGFSESSHYEWYRVESENDIELLEDFYEENIEKPESYPSYICVETEDESYYGQPYDYNLDQAKSITREFFNKFCINVEFKEKK